MRTTVMQEPASPGLKQAIIVRATEGLEGSGSNRCANIVADKALVLFWSPYGVEIDGGHTVDPADGIYDFPVYLQLQLRRQIQEVMKWLGVLVKGRVKQFRPQQVFARVQRATRVNAG